MGRQTLVGIAAAIFAAFGWSLNFIGPYVIGPHSIYDLAVCRFLLSGIVGASILGMLHRSGFALSLRDWMVTAWLGFVGYVGYFLTIMAAVLYAGPVIPPAFVALVPMVLAVAGNLGQRGTPWSSISLSISLATAGLLLVNASSIARLATEPIGSTGAGIGFSVAAIALWTVFGLSNDAALRKRPAMDARRWTAAMMIGGSIEIVAFIPVGLSLGLFQFPRVNLHVSTAGPLILFAFALAAIGSIGGSWAWTIATRRLSIGLAGQLLVTETLFATTFGLIASHRWPTWSEALGLALLIVGVVAAIGTLHRQGRMQSEKGTQNLAFCGAESVESDLTAPELRGTSAGNVADANVKRA